MFGKIVTGLQVVESQLVAWGITPAVVKSVAGKVVTDLLNGSSPETILDDLKGLFSTTQLPSS